MSIALADFQWLTSDDSQEWLALAQAQFATRGYPAPQLVKQLRRTLSPDRAHLVLEQVELRARAREKFTLAARMFFTRKGLEQATDERIAAYKAARFPSQSTIADFCCGIGGDLIALAQRGGVVGVELDPAVAHLANWNCQMNGIAADRLAMQVTDAASFPLATVAAWHIDPDRRSTGKRTTRIELHEPPLEDLERMVGQNARAAIKLAPAADVPQSWQDSAEREWIGSRGECRQQVAWFGELAQHAGQRAATIVDAAGGVRTIVGEPDRQIPVASQIGRYLYEPHAAVLAAHLEGVLTEEHALAQITPQIAYYTADSLVRDAALDAFEVLDVLPFDRKRLKAYFRERNVGRLEVKKRGSDVDPDKLRREVLGDGDNEATLLVAPVGKRLQAIVARRMNLAF